MPLLAYMIPTVLIFLFYSTSTHLPDPTPTIRDILVS